MTGPDDSMDSVVYFMSLWPFLLVLAVYAVIQPLRGGCILNELGWRDVCPTALWFVDFTVNNLMLHFFVVLMQLYIAVNVMRKWTRLVIMLLGAMDAWERWAAKVADTVPDVAGISALEEGGIAQAKEEQIGEELAEQKCNVEIEDLRRLEDLAKKGLLKKPLWVLMLLAFLTVCQIGAVVFLHIYLSTFEMPYHIHGNEAFTHFYGGGPPLPEKSPLPFGARVKGRGRFHSSLLGCRCDMGYATLNVAR